MKQTLIHILLLMGLAGNLQGQMAMDTISLPEVKLVESRVKIHSIGSNIDIIDAELLGFSNSNKLADYLSVNTSFYIKQYGALATPTFRGTSSSHTLLLWNGVPINSIANGLSDLSILPLSTTDEVAIVHGGDGSVFGSGAMGGSIHFNSNTSFTPKKEIILNREIGSFGFKSKSLSLNHTVKDLSIQLLFHDLVDQNNFEFRNITQIEHPMQTNNYGSVTSKQTKVDVAYKINNSNQIFAHYWQTESDREVPQNMTTPFSDAKQYDNNTRMLISSISRIGNLSFKIKQAYLEEDFRYTELLKNIDSKYLTKNNLTDVDLRMHKGNYLFNIGTSLANKSVANNNYLDAGQKEKQTSLFYAVQFSNDFLHLNTVLRKEWQTSFEVPYIPTLAFSGEINPFLSFRFKYNRNFRSPTFNDRFWAGAGANGNPNLTPEDAWNKEGGFDYKSDVVEFSSTVYSLHISDMIVWQQQDNGNWMPDNVKEVWSRGLESNLKIKVKDLSMIANYSFTRSTSEITTDNLDISVGKQLRYVPFHKGNISFILSEGDLDFVFNQSYTGEVTTTYGSKEDKRLDAFILTDIAIRSEFKKSPISLECKVKNLLDKEYQTYQNYPNPGRELLLTLKYIIN